MFAFTAPTPLASSLSRQCEAATSPRRAPPRMTIASPRPPSPTKPPSPGPSSSQPLSVPSAPPSAPPPPEPIQLIDGVQEYLAAVESSQHTLMVLKVFAPWCRSCRALAPKVTRLAREFPEVRFYEMDFERNKPLCARLGVRSMPTFIFYQGEAGEVEKFSCGPMRAGVLREKLQQCLAGFCSLEQH